MKEETQSLITTGSHLISEQGTTAKMLASWLQRAPTQASACFAQARYITGGWEIRRTSVIQIQSHHF